MDESVDELNSKTDFILDTSLYEISFEKNHYLLKIITNQSVRLTTILPHLRKRHFIVWQSLLRYLLFFTLTNALKP